MHEYTFTTDLGSEIRIRIESNHAGSRAYSIWFDSNADIKAETHGDTLFMEYCHTCICISELAKMNMNDMLAWSALESVGMSCECDD